MANEIETIKLRLIEDASRIDRYKLLGFIVSNDPEYATVIEPLRGKYDISKDFAEWLLNTHNMDIRQDFIDDFGIEDLRVCHNCGEFLAEGYYLEGEWACSYECAVQIYEGYGTGKWELDAALEAAETYGQEDTYYKEL